MMTGKAAPGKALRLFAFSLLLSVCLLLSGCAERVVLTTGFDRDEVFTVGDRTAHIYELKIFLSELESEYRAKFGSGVFEKAGFEDLGEAVRENALARLCRVKVLACMARERGIGGEEEDLSRAAQAAQDWYDTLGEEEKAYLDTEPERLADTFADYASAAAMHRILEEESLTEVSDDEARRVQIQCITIRTYKTGQDGMRLEYTAEQRNEARARANAILQEIHEGIRNYAGIPFDSYVTRYNEEGSGFYTLGRGEVDEEFEEAAFSVALGTISNVEETRDGFRIIKCVGVSDREEIEKRKEELAAERSKARYAELYDAYAQGLEVRFLENVWDGIVLTGSDMPGIASFTAAAESI